MRKEFVPYRMTSRVKYIPGAGVRRVYGIETSGTQRMRLHDLSTKREHVRGLVERMNDLRVSPAHIEAVVLDSLPL